MRRIPSSSTRLPCSTDATPARTARLIASAPWACAATFFPHIAASSTTAFSSSSDSTPALASYLDQVGPVLDLPADLAADLVDAVGDPAGLLEPQIGREAV